MKKKLSVEEWFSISLATLYVVITFFVALGVDPSHRVMARNNMFAGLAELFNIPIPAKSYSGLWILLIFYLVFILIAVILIVLTRKYFINRNQNPNSVRSIVYYSVIGFSSLAISTSLGIVFQLFEKSEDVGGIANLDETFGFVFGVLFLGLLIFVFLAAFVYAIVGIVNYFARRKNKNIAQVKSSEDEELEKVKENSNIDPNLENSFSGVKDNKVNKSAETSVVVTSDNSNTLFSNGITPKEIAFKNLVAIDNSNIDVLSNSNDDINITLKDLVNNLQGYLATSEKLYYDKIELGYFIAGLKASKLIILEGISGTGKSSLPRYFAKYISEESFFEPIQVTYKEKSDLLGYYNEITNKYSETPLLENLYKASYKINNLNIVVLDEMNISRIEYYFADFLSLLEFPENERKLSLLLLPDDYDAPNNLNKGELLITPNTYFIGTANKDDSTYTITDKVIDRAIVLNFNNVQDKLKIKGDFTPISLSYSRLMALFDDALNKFKFEKDEVKDFNRVLKFLEDELDISIGNRMLKQIECMIPIFKDMELDYKECIDIFLSSKVLRKLEVRFNSSLSSSVLKLSKLLDEIYGKNSLKRCKELLNKYIKRGI